ncbi:hypothetical protein ACWZEH_34890 (plasmid) [Streptomyces sp. QTS137]
MKRITATVTTVAAAIAATLLSTAGVATASDIGWPVPPKTTAATTGGDIGWPVAPGTTATEGIA